MPNAHPEQILKLPTESFASALRELDPASRALLDLSLRRGMRPDEIADMLGADEATVVSSRDHALDQLAADLGARRDQLDDLRARLAELPAEEWTGGRAEQSNGGEPAAPGAVRPRPAQERPRGRLLLVALLVLAIAGIVVAIVLGSGGGSKTKSPAVNAPAPAPPPPPKPVASGPAAPVTPVGSAAAHVKGTSRVSGGTITLDVTGL